MARWLDRLLVLTLVAGVALTALTTPAAAHGQLVVSTPAKDSTVSTPLESLALYFTEKPSADAYFTLTAPSGVRVDRPWSHGEPIRLDEPVQEYTLINGVWEPSLYHTGFPAKVPVAHWPERGLYVARYQSVASDGEAVQGEVRFTYTGKTSAPPKGWKAPTNPPNPALLAALGHGGPTPTRAFGATTPQPASPAVPQTGPQSAPATPQAGSQPAPPTDSGTGVMVWLLPAVLVAGVGVMVVRAARRPSPSGTTRPHPAGPRARTPAQRAAPPRKARRTKAAKRR
ncbi:copper resistance CopC family protein [Streptosporangium lutulentum]|uniref:Methionine-rich copper-binding protein CopC n=1 Tax=Streptosporangium lutulentum TaxID=1461250 RepID=A0ABT9QBC5_9ACTN|nr:copper resistance protein CopC [Streptosporangium lutulentum]MDP9844067.1 methionine-rich copper-binding protein CopC [Streptosporangium lutulentum]